MPAQADDLLILERGGVLYKEEHRDVAPIIVHLGGQFLGDPNEFNGWGVIGPFDDTNAQDLGNVGAAVNRLAGGYTFPWDLRITRFYAWHRDNNTQLGPWGWRMVRQQKTADSNVVTNTDMLAEVAANGGVGPRDYPGRQNRLTDITAFDNDTLLAGETIVLGIETPTTATTNRYVQVMSGYLLFERI